MAGLIFVVSIIPIAILQWRKSSRGAGVPAAEGQGAVVPR